MNPRTVIEYLLQSEENLRIAERIHEAWPCARSEIVGAFCQRLGDRFRTRFPEWKADVWERPFEDRWAIQFFHKPKWRVEYYITLQFREYGERMRIGVCRDEHKIPGRTSDPKILAKVQAIYPGARSEKTWWDAFIELTDPARDWRPPEVLWRMHTDETFFVSVLEQVVELAQAVEPVLDKITAPKSST